MHQVLMCQLEKPLWLVCIHCVPRAHVQELKGLCGYFCSISVTSPGGVWDGA